MTEPVRTSRLGRLRNLEPRQRTLAIVLAVVVVAVVLFLLLGGGGGGIQGVNETPVVKNPTPTPTATTTSPPETGQAFEGKDPFQPLVLAIAPGPSGSPAPTPTGSVTPVGGGGSGTATTVTLIDIRRVGGVLEATVDVDGKDYTVKQGETFAGNFRVVSLNSSCGTFTFGDERFSLCVGQEVRK